MLFTEFRFLIFFLIVFSICWGLPKNSQRKVWLLLCSYIFYGAWDWRFMSLIFASTVIDYIVGLMLGQDLPKRQRKAWLLVSLVANLGFLGFFKYYNFFIDSAASFLGFLGLSASFKTLDVILPVGISFYTFQTLSYSLDIYWGKLKANKNFLDFALYVSFFPQLVAGPIVRASDFLVQLKESRRFDRVDVRGYLMLFLVGFIKKACISDNLAPTVDRYFNNPDAYTAVSSWLGVLSYTTQIYCDFSGYSDMAIACAGLLGYQLCLNFNFPYFASNISQFWRRWNISLSNWLRDYLYIPLGGNRQNAILTYRNLMATMLLGGLWHGAAWNFVLWGGLHGFALAVHRLWSQGVSQWAISYFHRTGDKPKKHSTPTGDRELSPHFWNIGKLVGCLLTFYWVCITWIFFRATDLASALAVVRSFVFFDSPGTRDLGVGALWIFIPLALVHWVAYRGGLSHWWRRIPAWSFAGIYGVVVALVVPFVPLGYTPFIYFQF